MHERGKKTKSRAVWSATRSPRTWRTASQMASGGRQPEDQRGQHGRGGQAEPGHLGHGADGGREGGEEGPPAAHALLVHAVRVAVLGDEQVPAAVPDGAERAHQVEARVEHGRDGGGRPDEQARGQVVAAGPQQRPHTGAERGSRRRRRRPGEGWRPGAGAGGSPRGRPGWRRSGRSRRRRTGAEGPTAEQGEAHQGGRPVGQHDGDQRGDQRGGAEAPGPGPGRPSWRPG